MRSVVLSFLLAAMTVFVAAGCRQADPDWIERYKRSVRSDIDLYLVPERFAVLESSWLKKSAIARYDRAQLEAALKTYGRSLDDLRRNAQLDYKENGNTVTMKVGRISHSTAYDYDTSIPIIFHGKWLYYLKVLIY